MRAAFAMLLLIYAADGAAGGGEPPGEEPPNPFGPKVVRRGDAVPGKLTRSNAEVFRGQIFLTRDKRLELHCDSEKKWYKLKLKDLSRLEWVVEFEREEREWRWKEAGSDVKVYTGRKKIDRKYKTVATRKDGRKIEGHIRGTVIYVQPEKGRKRRFFLYWNHPSDFDQKPEELVYTKAVHFGEEHARAPQSLTPGQVGALTPILKGLAGKLAKLKDRCPEMKAFEPKKALFRDKTSLGLVYSNAVLGSAKGVRTFGKHGLVFYLGVTAGPKDHSPPTLFGIESMKKDKGWSIRPRALERLGLCLYAGLQAGAAPSEGLVDELKRLIASQCEEICKLDERAVKAGPGR